MSKTKFVDFRAIKAAITMEQLLVHYNILDQFNARHGQPQWPVPDPQGEQSHAVPHQHHQEHLELFQRLRAWRQHPRLHR